MTKIAVIADPHVHDCSWQPENSGLTGAIRSFAETAASTRVFNESIPAFRAALERAVAEGAKLVLLVGDLTDDGQEPNIRAALKILADYRQRHGLRVLATPGNHDFYALAGRPQIKTFLTADGAPVVVDSAHSPDAATIGTAPALKLMAHLGYRPEPSDLHWETPFGTDPDFAARSYLVASPDGQSRVQMIDSSYLVEPVAESGFSRWTPMSARRAMGWSIPPIPRPITTRPMAVGARSWRIAPICSAGWPMLPRAPRRRASS
ncbi:metallophosphoesterase [Paracoccus cavernae]|uniref:Metallophosphoesterase n=1 Tax=Paracoccus cavernae TaxID=1571207 RepID=A0ABT8DBI0_9RHOB|nr:metallophosphoesterase [Paracoccus cavernae]